MIDPFLRWLLGVDRTEEVRLARAEMERDRAALDAHLDAEERAFIAEMEARSRTPHTALGECPPGVPYRVALAAFDGTHSWTSAGTGSGKTRFVASLVAALLLALVGGAPLAVVCLAMQGDLVDLVLRALGALLLRAPAGRRSEVLSRLTVARFFRGATLPPFDIFTRSPHAPLLVQAQTLAEVIEHSLGAALGSRQETALTMLVALAIEAGLPVNALRLLLHDRNALEALARRSAEPLVTAYILNRFARESSATTDGIASRLDRLISLDDGLRGALAGPGTIDFAGCFRPGAISCFDLSGSPLGGDGARRALGALTIQALVSAALSSTRRIEGPTVLVVDEAQLALTPATMATLSTAVTTIRAAKVGIHFVNQSLAQLPREFVQLLSTNVTWRFLGRSGATDAAMSAEFLPRTGRVPKPRPPFGPPGERVEFLSRSEEETFRIAECGALPRRTFFMTERSAPFGVRRLEAPAFDPPAWDRLPSELRTALERGATGVPRNELIARAREVEARAMASSGAASDEAEEPPEPKRRARRGVQAPATPDAVTRAEKWSRRGRKTP